MTTETQAPAWDRFATMAQEVNDMLIGAAQCRNHLRCILDGGYDMNDELKAAVADALHRLERVGI